jgi:alkylated DNA repair protein (DNA oxidative demethylase)
MANTDPRPTVPSRRSRMRASRLGGVPTNLPPGGAIPATRLALSFDSPPVRTELLPGVVLIKGWLDVDEQRSLVEQFRTWALPPAGLRHPRMPSGHLMSVQSVCLGWHWYPYVYSRLADDTDGTPVKPMPTELVELGRRAVADAFGTGSAAAYAPDAVIANLYAPGAKLGIHADAEEPSEAPVVTISVGDACTFRLAGVDRRTGPFTDIELESGDLVVFGGASRRIYHGVPKVHDGSSPADVGLPAGRLSITIRETGF